MHAFLNTIRSHLTFYGRTSRADFWLAHIVLLPMLFSTLLIVGTYVGGRSIWTSMPFLLLVVPWAALVVRRLHDMGRTGWWALGSLIPTFVVPSLGVPFGLVIVLALGVPRGTPGPNRHGGDPLNSEPTGPVADPTAALGTPTIEQPIVRHSADLITHLERLSLLRANGTLTATEFEAMKAQALAQVRTA